MKTSGQTKRSVTSYMLAVSITILAITCAMQCYARTKCPDDQGASWSLTNGTVCFGERK